jgi:hypothetical protein
VKTQQKTETEFIRDFFVYIAAVPAIAGFLGSLFIGQNFFRTVLWSVLFFGCSIAGVSFLSKAILFLAKNFNSQEDEATIFKLSVFAFAPILLAGVFLLVPPLSWLTVVGLYGFFFFWMGFNQLIDCPEEEKFNFLIISLVVLLITTLLVFLLPALISGAAVYYRVR